MAATSAHVTPSAPWQPRRLRVDATHVWLPHAAGAATLAVDGAPWAGPLAQRRIDGCDYMGLQPPEGPPRFLATRRLLDLRDAGGASLPGWPRPAWNPPRRPRLLVLLPGRDLVLNGRDDVAPKDPSPAALLAHDSLNTGDALVYDSMLKLLEFADLRPLPLAAPPERAAQFNNFDACVVRGSNFIRNDMDWQGVPAVLERLRIPVVPIGVGAQAPMEGPWTLSAAQHRFWQLVSGRCAHIGVRGERSAEALAQAGVRNVRIVGCPSAFRARDPALALRAPQWSTLRSVAWSLRRIVNTECVDGTTYRAQHRDALLRVSRDFALELSSHGEWEERALALGDAAQRAQAQQRLRDNGWLGGADDPVAQLYEPAPHFSASVGEHEDWVRARPFVAGLRVHGNLAALAAGVPAAQVTYDSRSLELAQTLGIPHVTLAHAAATPAREWLSALSFDAWNAGYAARYAAMADFLDANGLPHRMWAADPL